MDTLGNFLVLATGTPPVIVDGSPVILEGFLAQVVFPLLLSIATLAFGWVAKRGADYLKEAKKNVKNQFLKGVIDTIGGIGLEIVGELNQVVVTNLKAAAQDGKLTAQEITYTLQTAIDKAWDMLSDEARAMLTQLAGSEEAAKDTYIRPSIESAVGKLKAQEKRNTELKKQSGGVSAAQQSRAKAYIGLR